MIDQLEDLVTGAELARRLDVSRSRAHQLIERPDFPQPLGRIGRYKVFRWRDVDAWARSARLPGRGRRRQEQLRVERGGFVFEAIPDEPGAVRITEPGGTTKAAIAWPGSPIVQLDILAGDVPALLVRTARSEGTIARNSKGTWALVDVRERAA